MRVERPTAFATLPAPPLEHAAAHAKEVARGEDRCAVCRVVCDGRRQGHVVSGDNHPPFGCSYRWQGDEEADAGGQGPQEGNNEEEE